MASHKVSDPYPDREKPEMYHRVSNMLQGKAIQYQPNVVSSLGTMNYSASSLTSGNPDMDAILSNLTVTR